MSDYDFEPREAPSVFLKLKEKGDKVLIRLASPPYREPKVWKIDSKPPMGVEPMLQLSEEQWRTIYRDPDYNVTETFSWKVLDRVSGQAKIFTGTPGVYKTIKKYAEMDGWGDPKNYDIQIERTEQPGPSYYAVTPMPTKEPLLERELKLVEALNLQEKLPAARKLSETQVDHIPEMDEQETTPPADKLDTVITDIPGEPISLDDIPF